MGLDAVRRAEAIADFLESKGKKVERPGGVNLGTIIKEQINGARLLFQQQSYKVAAEEYLKALNMAPDMPEAASALGELAQCYVNIPDPLYARLIIRYLAERYSRNAAHMEEAGNAVLNVAAACEKMNDRSMAAETYDLFLQQFPEPQPNGGRGFPVRGDEAPGREVRGGRGRFSADRAEVSQGPRVRGRPEPSRLLLCEDGRSHQFGGVARQVRRRNSPRVPSR